MNNRMLSRNWVDILFVCSAGSHTDWAWRHPGDADTRWDWPCAAGGPHSAEASLRSAPVWESAPGGCGEGWVKCHKAPWGWGRTLLKSLLPALKRLPASKKAALKPKVHQDFFLHQYFGYVMTQWLRNMKKMSYLLNIMSGLWQGPAVSSSAEMQCTVI